MLEEYDQINGRNEKKLMSIFPQQQFYSFRFSFIVNLRNSKKVGKEGLIIYNFFLYKTTYNMA